MARPVPAPLLAWLDGLRCPQCAAPLAAADGALRCTAGHSFDLARAGYASLLRGGGAISGDDDEMARARERFLATGAYAPLREVLGELAAATVPALAGPSAVLDMGSGPGYYLAGILDRFPAARGLGIDTSARSLRFAARAHERAAAALGDVFAPFPLADDSVDLLLDVFAPRNPPEFARVLRPEGALLVARPAAEHLGELRETVPGMVDVDPHKEERLAQALDPHLVEVERREVRTVLDLGAEAARDLVAMTPSARHVDPSTLDDVLGAARGAASGAGLQVTLAVVVSAHRPR